MPLNRRHFLHLIGSLTAAATLHRAAAQTDWDRERPVVAEMRRVLEAAFTGREMALDLRCINDRDDLEFTIQIRAFDFFPVASCFKAFVAFYYFFYTPEGAWDAGEGTDVYRMIVFSDNGATGAVLAEVAGQVLTPGNPIEKFNDFLYERVGIYSGLHTWNWEGSRTVGFSDPRYEPGGERLIPYNGEFYAIDNVFTAAALARGMDVLLRGRAFAQWEQMQRAVTATYDLMAIPAAGYQAPIERVFPQGYTGKDGVLPASDLPVGRVMNDAGVVEYDGRRYIIAYLSMGEGDLAAYETLEIVRQQIEVYEAE
jgi:hypothetical protein